MNASQHHPSQWSPEILYAITPTIRDLQLPVHDPFAGTGERLGALCDTYGLPFSGTEIEPEFIVDDRVVAADAADPAHYPESCIVVTSPVYPNGMADHFAASVPEGRHTYRQALHRITGADRELAERNMGRFSARRGLRAVSSYMDLAREVVACWPPRPVLVNVSDFVIRDETFPLVAYWHVLLMSLGYETRIVNVPTRRQRYGANGERRVEHEALIIGVHEGEDHAVPGR